MENDLWKHPVVGAPVSYRNPKLYQNDEKEKLTSTTGQIVVGGKIWSFRSPVTVRFQMKHIYYAARGKEKETIICITTANMKQVLLHLRCSQNTFKELQEQTNRIIKDSYDICSYTVCLK